MNNKKVLSMLMIGLFVLGIVLLVVNDLQAGVCYTSVDCGNKSIWCKAWGKDISCEADENSVTCKGGGATITVTCPAK